MSSFIPHNNQSNVPAGIDPVVPDDNYYPSLSLTTYRQVMRVDDAVSHERAIDCIESAMMVIINDVKEWRERQTDALDAIKAKLFQKAVFHRAKALSIEKYRDIDTTNDGHAKADAMDELVDTHLQRSREFQRLLTDRKRITASLI